MTFSDTRVSDTAPRRPPHPAGSTQGITVDVVNLGSLPTPWGVKRKVRIYWETAEETMDTRTNTMRPQIVSATFTASLSDKANLRTFLENMRGTPFTAAELAEFDLEQLIGLNCILTIRHETTRKGDVYAKVTGASPLMKGMVPLAKSPGFKRLKHRTPEEQVQFFERVLKQEGGQATAGVAHPPPSPPPPSIVDDMPTREEEDERPVVDEDDDLPF